MSKHTDHTSTRKQESQEFGDLADDARALMAATAEVAGDKVAEARKRLSETLGNIRQRMIETAKSTDKAVRENPYQAMGIALGVGFLVGWFVSNRFSRND